MPSAAATAGSAPSGTSIASASPIDARSAIVPFAVRPSDPPKSQTSRPSPGPADALAPRDVRQVGVAGGEDAARDGEVDRVERRREHVDGVGALGRGGLADLRNASHLADERRPHGRQPSRAIPLDAADGGPGRPARRRRPPPGYARVVVPAGSDLSGRPATRRSSQGYGQLTCGFQGCSQPAGFFFHTQACSA